MMRPWPTTFWNWNLFHSDFFSKLSKQESACNSLDSRNSGNSRVIWMILIYDISVWVTIFGLDALWLTTHCDTKDADCENVALIISLMSLILTTCTAVKNHNQGTKYQKSAVIFPGHFWSTARGPPLRLFCWRGLIFMVASETPRV